MSEATEQAIRSQMARGMDTSVPLADREPTTPRVQGVVTCDDRRMLSKHGQASYVKPGEDTTELRLPSNAAVIDRNAPVQVIRGEEAGAPVEVMEQVGGTIRSEPQNIVYADRPPPADLGVAQPDVQQPYEYGIGVANDPGRSATQLGDIQPIRDAGEAQTGVPMSDNPMTQVVREQKVGGQPKVHRKAITIASDRMGRHRVRVVIASVSDSNVVLGYLNTDDETIIEPPMADQENPLTITIDGKAYKCVSYGLTNEFTFAGYPLLQVVLPRIPE